MKTYTVDCSLGSFKVRETKTGASVQSDLDIAAEFALVERTLESLVLGHVCAGLDVTSEAYVDGLDRMGDWLLDHLEDA